jgi:2'-5' RNA ligase
MEHSRLFVAVWPPPDVVALLADTVARLAPSAPDGLRWTRPEQWHATLAFLGTQDVEATVAAFRRINLPPGPVQAHVGPETGRFGSRIVHVPVAGLDGVAAAVRAALPGDGDRPVSGHLTLARADGRRRVEAGQGRW